MALSLFSKKSSNSSYTSTNVTTNNIVTDSGAIEAMQKTAGDAIALSGSLGLGAFDLADRAFQVPTDVIKSLTDRDERFVKGLAESVQTNLKDFAQKVVAPANDIAEQLKEFGIIAVIGVTAIFVFRGRK